MANERIEPSYLAKLQENVNNIRNFCILAHVDHGKTTLSDSLVCSNGVISPKLSGKIRFLDSTEEEQRRGITMHSSAIALLFRLEDKSGGKTEKVGETPSEEYLINLVDSPGHIDFSSDVSTATRLCDGALIVIDVLEGLCTQTHAVIYKALRERMKPCLVLNKLDRLAIEMKLTPTEAFHHLRRIIENVNALAFSLLTSEVRQIAELEGGDPNIEISDDDPFLQEWNFSPEKGNVIFACAFDSWGFSVTKFSNIWAKKLGLNRNTLQKYFFEDYSFNANTKKLIKHNPSDTSTQPMFAEMILQPIWNIYEAAVVNGDLGTAVNLAKQEMNIDLPPREINNRDPRSTLQSILRRWLPLSDAILRMIVRVVPNPAQAQSVRINNLLPNLSPSLSNANSSTVETIRRVYENIRTCSTAEDAEVTMFISKLTPIRAGDLSATDFQMLRNKRQLLDPQLDLEGPSRQDIVMDSTTEIFMGLGRLFSGVISRDKDLYILGSRHNPLSEDTGNLSLSSERMTQTVQRIPAGSFGLYICLGPSAYPVDKAYAGNIIGVIGLDDYVFKTGTISTTDKTYPMKAITFQAKPMLKVALETPSHFDLPKLAKGLESLYQYDPVVEVGIDDSGQHTMTCLGELHLELCLKTLIEKFAKCEVRASEPLVSFRETVLEVDESDNASAVNWLPFPWKDVPMLENSHHGRYKLHVALNNLSIGFRCFPLPVSMATLIEENSLHASMLAEYLIDTHRSGDENTAASVLSYWAKIQEIINESGHSYDRCLKPSDSVLNRLLALGPRNVGPNILLFDSSVEIAIYSSSVSKSPLSYASQLELMNGDNPSSEVLFRIPFCDRKVFDKIWNRIRGSVISGFQFATSSGPIMNEPLHGVGYVIESVAISYAAVSGDFTPEELMRYIPNDTIIEDKGAAGSQIMTGQLISEVRDVLRLCMLSCPMRVVEPIYACELQCDQAQLGNLYSVVSKRRGEVTKEDIIDGTSLFLLSVYLPVVESFSFTQELLNKTSGIGTAPQLRFSHWAQMDTDPFWRAKTEKELEEYGDQGMELNKVRILVDKVRKRKGLPIDEKIVVSAEKQRNMRK